MACSMSPLASVSAFLQSIIPAPVFSRSSFTDVALISISIPFEQRNSHGWSGCNELESVKSVKSVALLLHHCGFVRRLDCRLVIARNARAFRLRASSERHDDAFIFGAFIAFVGLRRRDTFLVHS